MAYAFNDDKSKASLADLIYPVGSIYMSINNTDPSELFGGAWEPWGQGRVPVGVDSSQTEFDSVEKTGGEKKHTLLNNEMPKHDHGSPDSSRPYFIYGGSSAISTGTTDALPGNTRTYPFYGYTGDGYRFAANGSTSKVGGSAAHNNLQPYITCYMWLRVS